MDSFKITGQEFFMDENGNVLLSKSAIANGVHSFSIWGQNLGNKSNNCGLRCRIWVEKEAITFRGQNVRIPEEINIEGDKYVCL